MSSSFPSLFVPLGVVLGMSLVGGFILRLYWRRIEYRRFRARLNDMKAQYDVDCYIRFGMTNSPRFLGYVALAIAARETFLGYCRPLPSEDERLEDERLKDLKRLFEKVKKPNGH